MQGMWSEENAMVPEKLLSCTECCCAPVCTVWLRTKDAAIDLPGLHGGFNAEAYARVESALARVLAPACVCYTPE